MLMPIGYTFICIYQGKFEISELLLTTLTGIGFGVGTSLTITVKELFMTQHLLKRLKQIDMTKVADGNLSFSDNYDGWQRVLEFNGTIKGRKILIHHKFKEGWLFMVPHLCVFVGPEFEMIDELKIDKEMTGESISKSIDDACKELCI